MRTLAVVIGIGVAVATLCSCTEPARDNSGPEENLGTELGLEAFVALAAEEYGPWYSERRSVNDMSVILCFTIRRAPDGPWRVQVKGYLDRNGDPRAEAVIEDTDGDGKFDKGKFDTRPYDGKFDKEWIDRNGDGEVQGNEVRPLDPEEATPPMPDIE